jgi:RIMS-binding protein 2
MNANEVVLKATVSGLDLASIHRISVKSVTKDQKMSNEAGCTMVIGKEAPLRPTSVKAIHLTSTSATITWIPSNTNFMHAIIVNNVEVKTVKQGVFKHALAGLSPNTTYKVKVRAKNLKAASYLSDSYNCLTSGVLEVTTRPQGLPEPPLDLQVAELFTSVKNFDVTGHTWP